MAAATQRNPLGERPSERSAYLLYSLAALLGDMNAVRWGQVPRGRSPGSRDAHGPTTGGMFG